MAEFKQPHLESVGKTPEAWRQSRSQFMRSTHTHTHTHTHGVYVVVGPVGLFEEEKALDAEQQKCVMMTMVLQAFINVSSSSRGCTDRLCHLPGFTRKLATSTAANDHHYV